MPLSTADVLKASGGDNFAGLKRFAYFARLDDIDTFPAHDTATGYDDKTLISSDITFTTGNCFKKLQLEVGKSNLDSVAAGERGSKSTENTALLYHSRVSKEILGWIEEHKNDDLVIIVEELDGKARLLGSADLPATIENFEIMGGAEVSDEKSAKITVRYVGHIAPVYEGTISVTPAA